jgi:hypothetical protein
MLRTSDKQFIINWQRLFKNLEASSTTVVGHSTGMGSGDLVPGARGSWQAGRAATQAGMRGGVVPWRGGGSSGFQQPQQSGGPFPYPTGNPFGGGFPPPGGGFQQQQQQLRGGVPWSEDGGGMTADGYYLPAVNPFDGRPWQQPPKPFREPPPKPPKEPWKLPKGPRQAAGEGEAERAVKARTKALTVSWDLRGNVCEPRACGDFGAALE